MEVDKVDGRDICACQWRASPDRSVLGFGMAEVSCECFRVGRNVQLDDRLANQEGERRVFGWSRLSKRFIVPRLVNEEASKNELRSNRKKFVYHKNDFLLTKRCTI